MMDMFMVAGKLFDSAEEAIRYGKKRKGVDIFNIMRVDIYKSGETDISTDMPVKKALKKLRKVM